MSQHKQIIKSLKLGFIQSIVFNVFQIIPSKQILPFWAASSTIYYISINIPSTDNPMSI